MTHCSESKRRDSALEELNDVHLLNAERKLARAPHHAWKRVELDEYPLQVVQRCHMCGTNEMSSESSECPKAPAMLEALRAEIVRRGLHEPKPEPGAEAQDICWG